MATGVVTTDSFRGAQRAGICADQETSWETASAQLSQHNIQQAKNPQKEGLHLPKTGGLRHPKGDLRVVVWHLRRSPFFLPFFFSVGTAGLFFSVALQAVIVEFIPIVFTVLLLLLSIYCEPFHHPFFYSRFSFFGFLFFFPQTFLVIRTRSGPAEAVHVEMLAADQCLLRTKNFFCDVDFSWSVVSRPCLRDPAHLVLAS